MIRNPRSTAPRASTGLRTAALVLLLTGVAGGGSKSTGGHFVGAGLDAAPRVGKQARELYQASERLLAAKRYWAALTKARAAEKADSAQGFLSAHVGNILLYHLDRPREALAAYARANARGYRESWLNRARGVAYRKLKRYDRAVLFLERAHAQGLTDQITRMNLAFALVLRGNLAGKRKQHDRAHQDYKRAFALAPRTDYVHFHYAMSLANTGQQRKAIAVLEAGLKRYPSYPWFRPNLTFLYVADGKRKEKQGDAGAAGRRYAQAYRLSPDKDYAMLHYALSLRARGEYRQAVELLQKGRRKFPAYKWFRTNIPPTFSLAIQHYRRANNKAQVLWWSRRALAAADGAHSFETPWNSTLVHAAIAGFQFSGNQPAYERALELLQKHFPKAPRLLEALGLGLFFVHQAGAGPAVQRRVRKIRRRAMELFERKHPRRLRIKGLHLPLRGLFAVGDGFDGEAWSHVGLSGKYCYDLFTVGSDGSPLRPGTTGKRNQDFHTFGATLYAVRAGVVAAARDSIADQTPGTVQAKGNMLEIQHAGGVRSYYDHLQKGSLLVKPGSRVGRGQAVARVGNTGISGSPHVHFCMFARDGVSTYFEFDSVPVRRFGAGSPGKTYAGVFKKGWLVQGP